MSFTLKFHLRMSKINLAIIGAQKAGTTSLKNYLSQHPEIVSHPQLEFSFFRDSSMDEDDFENYFNKCFTLGNKEAKIKLAKNVGICNSDPALKKLFNHNPECKLIYILREPVDRFISAYNFEKFNGWLKNPIEDVVEVIQNRDKEHVLYKHFLFHGLYQMQIERILKYFNRDQLKIILFEDLKTNPKQVVIDIVDWISLDNEIAFDFSKTHNKTAKSTSGKLAKIILYLRKSEWLKRPFRKIMPYWLFTKISQGIINVNKSKIEKVAISYATKNSLRDFYKPEVDALVNMGVNLNSWYSTNEI